MSAPGDGTCLPPPPPPPGAAPMEVSQETQGPSAAPPPEPMAKVSSSPAPSTAPTPARPKPTPQQITRNTILTQHEKVKKGGTSDLGNVPMDQVYEAAKQPWFPGMHLRDGILRFDEELPEEVAQSRASKEEGVDPWETQARHNIVWIARATPDEPNANVSRCGVAAIVAPTHV